MNTKLRVIKRRRQKTKYKFLLYHGILHSKIVRSIVLSMKEFFWCKTFILRRIPSVTLANQKPYSNGTQKQNVDVTRICSYNNYPKFLLVKVFCLFLFFTFFYGTAIKIGKPFLFLIMGARYVIECIFELFFCFPILPRYGIWKNNVLALSFNQTAVPPPPKFVVRW